MATATSTLDERIDVRPAGDDAGRAQDDLVAMAVHDMKTPLAALQQALQIVATGRAGAVSEVQARFVAMAADNAQVLGSLLDRLQGTLMRGEGSDDVRPERMDVGEAARFVVRALQPSAQARGVTLQARCEEGVGDAWADPVLVRRVLLNLVANSLKYAGGGAMATVIVERTPGDPGFIALRVRDRGPGIPDCDQERVFAVRQRSAATCASEDGAGLGLAIVRDIARAHGGQAWVVNNAGAGCTFSVTLPACDGEEVGGDPGLRTPHR